MSEAVERTEEVESEIQVRLMIYDDFSVDFATLSPYDSILLPKNKIVEKIYYYDEELRDRIFEYVKNVARKIEEFLRYIEVEKIELVSNRVEIRGKDVTIRIPIEVFGKPDLMKDKIRITREFPGGLKFMSVCTREEPGSPRYPWVCVEWTPVFYKFDEKYGFIQIYYPDISIEVESWREIPCYGCQEAGGKVRARIVIPPNDETVELEGRCHELDFMVSCTF